MKFSSFARLFGQRWSETTSSRKRRGLRRPARPRTARPSVEGLEDRTVMSTLPSPLVSPPGALTGNFGPNANTPNASAPSIAVDPVNPQKMVAFWTHFDPTLTPTPLQSVIMGAFSTNAGQTWTPLGGVPTALTDPASDAM